MVADLAGYNRLMEAVEEGVIVRQPRHGKELIDPAIFAALGRIVKTTGDGNLAALIPRARFITLPGNNHALVPGTPAYDIFLQEFQRFVDIHADDTDTNGDSSAGR